MPHCQKFEECDSCINRENDPFQCDDCEDASNFEPDDYEDTGESISYQDFIEIFKEAA